MTTGEDLAKLLAAAVLANRDQINPWQQDVGSLAVLFDYNLAMQRVELTLMVKPETTHQCP